MHQEDPEQGDWDGTGQRFIDDVTDGMRAADLDIEFDRVPLPS